MSTFPERLTELRKATGLNQSDFGALGGVKKRAQLDYEGGHRSPDTNYLQALHASGIDINYLLTGMRTLKVAEEQAGYEIRPDQKALLDNYEHCTEEGKRMVLDTVLSGAKHQRDLQEQQAESGVEKKRAGRSKK